jgi:hypothetical protein
VDSVRRGECEPLVVHHQIIELGSQVIDLLRKPDHRVHALLPLL